MYYYVPWRRRKVLGVITGIIVASNGFESGIRNIVEEECPHVCGTPHGLSFCSHVDFSACRERDSWTEQDAKAKADYEHTLAFIDFENMRNNEDPATTCVSVLPTLKKIHCALQFPICEIGTSTDRLCLSSCEQALTGCAPLVAASFCNDVTLARGRLHVDDVRLVGDGSSSITSTCFTLDYTGPTYGLWIAGVAISVVFSILNSIGINLQKYSLQVNAKARIERGIYRQPLWLLGFLLICTGSILDFVAFGMAPQTLLAPLAAMSLVWNLFIAPIVHNETITRRNLVATGIIFLGVTITVIFAGHATPSYELDDLIRLYCEPVMYLYIFCVVIFVVFLSLAKKRIEQTGVGENELFHVICYGGIAGTFGGQSVLLAKSTVELIKTALWGNGTTDVFSHHEVYIMVGGMVTCLFCQITTLNGGLKRFDALVMIPVYQSFWILTSILGGVMYFEEYTSMTYSQTFMFTVGGGITLYGIFYLLAGPKSRILPHDRRR